MNVRYRVELSQAERLTRRSIQAIFTVSRARQRSERRRQSPPVGGYPDLKAPAS
jgi:hypothetical protein